MRLTEWDVRGLLAESLKCWHRLTGEEAAELVAFVQATQAAQPAPRRLTEAEITLLVEAYYEDFGSAPPDLIRQVESLIFGDAQAAQVPIYQYQLANGNWIDQTKESHDYNVRHGQATVRILYAAPSTKEGA